MVELQLIILGFVQGITEFLPISSSAHLILISELFNWQDQGINHDIAVHFGTLFAVIFYLRSDLVSILHETFLFLTRAKIKTKHFFIKIIISTLPAIIVGFFVYNYLIMYFRNIELIAYSCIFFGLILYVADRYSNSIKDKSSLNFFDAFIIGIFQCFAFIPGASRAGVTITGARFLGFDRKFAAIYSMLLSIPIILASLTLTIPNIISDQSSILDLKQMFISGVISFITAFISIKFMMKLITKYNYNIFIFYRIILGLGILLWIYL